MSLTSRRTVMARKRYKSEEIVAKLRQVDVLVSQGQNMVGRNPPDQLSPARRTARRRNLLHSPRGPNRHRELAAPLQHDQAARIARIQAASTGEVFVPAFAAWPAALRQPAPPATLAQPPALN